MRCKNDCSSQLLACSSVSSEDAERSFSKHGTVLSPLRQSMSTDSLRAHCSVFYNSTVL